MRNLIILIALLPLLAYGQAERSDIRTGNKLYKEGKYTEAEVKYKQASTKNAGSYEAAFNLGGSLYKQQRYEDAAAGYSKLLEDGSDIEKQANTFFNLGNTQFNMYKSGSGEDKSKRLDEAIESYKQALKRNPSDMQAKFNLAYAQKLKQEEDNKDKDNKDNKDNQDNKENKDQNNQDNKQDNKDKNQNDKNKDQNKDNKDKKEDKQDQQKQQQQQSKQDNERMLNAVQAAEDKTKKKVDEKDAQAVGVGSGKQW